MTDSVYMVMSPEFTEIDDVLGFGQGPSYSVREVKYVKACSHSEAKWKFIKYCRYTGNSDWIDENRHPFSGVRCVKVSKDEIAILDFEEQILA